MFGVLSDRVKLEKFDRSKPVRLNVVVAEGKHSLRDFLTAIRRCKFGYCG